MQIKHITNKGNILFIKLPDNYMGIAGLNFGKIYFWTTELKPETDYPMSVCIPNGNWEIQGLTAEITEEQANIMVEMGYSIKYDRLITALESFNSLTEFLLIETYNSQFIVLFEKI